MHNIWVLPILLGALLDDKFGVLFRSFLFYEVIFLRAIKSINHNAAICVDGNGREVITFGKGIGFPAMPYEITDLKVIKRTYYNISSHLIGLINEINEEIFDVSAAIVDQAKGMLKCQLNPNLVFSLADHINFAIKRQKEYGNVKLLFSYDIEQLYPKETKLGQYAVKLIKKNFSSICPMARRPASPYILSTRSRRTA